MKRWFCSMAVLLALAGPALALINVRFTPVDLARESKDIVICQVSAPKANSAALRFGAALKGTAPTAPVELDLGQADDQTFEQFPKTGGTGLLFTGDFSAASSNGATEDKPAAVLQVGTEWFALNKTGEKWVLGKHNPFDLSAVWAGSASRLADCVRYCLADPRAVVPATAGSKFVKDELLGRIPGKVTALEVQPDGAVLIRSDAGDRRWEFPARKETVLESKTTVQGGPVINDYDLDGRLDKIVVADDGPAFWQGQQTNLTQETGELDYHGRSKPPLAAVVDCDFNCDGRPDLLLLYREGLTPLVFFNRGFGCFGLARELVLQDSKLAAAQALAQGQQAGVFVDVNGDKSPDLLVVSAGGELWVLYTALEAKPGPSVTVRAATPQVVTAREAARSLGARQVGPGQSAVFWLSQPGPVELEWGGGQKKRVIAVKPVVVELDGAKQTP